MENAWPISLMSWLLLVSMWVHRQVRWCRTSQAAGPKSEGNRHFWIIQLSSWPWTFLPRTGLWWFFFFFSGGLDWNCLAGKRLHSLQSAWKYVWLKLDSKKSVFSPLWSSLSNTITLFYLFWHWCLLSSSFSLLVQFLQLRCQADKQGNYVSGVYGNSDWMKKGERKKVLW